MNIVKIVRLEINAIKHLTLPKTLYVKVEKDSEPEDDFIIASGNASDLSESGTSIVVGEYRLVRKVNLVNKTEVVKN